MFKRYFPCKLCKYCGKVILPEVQTFYSIKGYCSKICKDRSNGILDVPIEKAMKEITKEIRLKTIIKELRHLIEELRTSGNKMEDIALTKKESEQIANDIKYIFFSFKKALHTPEKTLNKRFLILKRDNFRCIYCGRDSVQKDIKLHIDHIIPRSKGGSDDINNLVTSCSECNLTKADYYCKLEEIQRIVTERNKNFKMEE